MARLFEDAGQNNRSWMCFVCGRKYVSYEEYKTHIVTEHEEGREYLKCPACEAPVRDVKTHFKVKHPNRHLPTDVQFKVTVWHDFSPNGTKKKKTRVNVRTGHFPSKKMNEDLYYRSGLEADFYKCLEEDPDIKTYKIEPFKVPYFWQGEWHNYIPDILVEFIDGVKEIWEVKPGVRTNDEQNLAKWNSADAQAKNIGWRFVVQTEVGLDKYRAKLKKKRQGN